MCKSGFTSNKLFELFFLNLNHPIFVENLSMIKQMLGPTGPEAA